MRAAQLLEIQRERGRAKDLAAQVWWTARVFGEDAVGGLAEAERASALLGSLHAEEPLREPDLVRG